MKIENQAVNVTVGGGDLRCEECLKPIEFGESYVPVLYAMDYQRPVHLACARTALERRAMVHRQMPRGEAWSGERGAGSRTGKRIAPGWEDELVISRTPGWVVFLFFVVLPFVGLVAWVIWAITNRQGFRG